MTQPVRSAGSIRPPLDPRRVRELEALRAPVRARVLAAYRRDAPAVMIDIESALARGDAGEVRDGAHRLKSSSAAIGANELAKLYAELEAMGRLDMLEDVTSLIREIRGELLRVLGGLSGIGTR